MFPAGQFQLVQWCVVHLDLACGVGLEAREQVGNGARTGAARAQQRQHLTSWQRLRWPDRKKASDWAYQRAVTALGSAGSLQFTHLAAKVGIGCIQLATDV